MRDLVFSSSSFTWILFFTLYGVLILLGFIHGFLTQAWTLESPQRYRWLFSQLTIWLLSDVWRGDYAWVGLYWDSIQYFIAKRLFFLFRHDYLISGLFRLSELDFIYNIRARMRSSLHTWCSFCFLGIATFLNTIATHILSRFQRILIRKFWGLCLFFVCIHWKVYHTRGCLILRTNNSCKICDWFWWWRFWILELKWIRSLSKVCLLLFVAKWQSHDWTPDSLKIHLSPLIISWKALM